MTASEVEKTKAQGGSPQEKVAASTSPQAKGDSGASPVKAVVSDKHKEAMSLFVAGKRDLLVKDIDSAVSSLAQACELLSAEFGETAYECADAYYYYGKALLEMARAESGVFGNALDGVPDGEDTDNSQIEDPEKMTEEERETVEKEVGEALDENFKALEEKQESRDRRKKSTTEDETEEDDEEAEDSDKPAEDSEKPAAEKAEEKAESEKPAAEAMESEPSKDEAKEDTESVGNEAKEGEDKKEQEAEDEEDPSNLQLAWEMLELAKVSYKHKLESLTDADEKKSVEMKVCETLLTLGEVSLENETYEQAVVDITECLNKRKELHAADSRRIAETQYQLGVALGHFEKFDEAVKALEDAIACFKKRMENLKNKSESVDETKANDAFYSREAEITELESLIPEIEEKIQDTKDMKKQSADNKAEESGFKQNGEFSGAKPISTISVKRKAEGSDSTSPKKAHVENGTDKK
uniref:Nuclear autoantigenic sperm protein n=1 Tax=Acartia pacifica TaxID=335913 RepID=A0A0U2V1G1_ACAPC|nr:nuclear autoantigenic sperm protein [Acartia pacifica]